LDHPPAGRAERLEGDPAVTFLQQLLPELDKALSAHPSTPSLLPPPDN
jgi:hypothetical protein